MDSSKTLRRPLSAGAISNFSRRPQYASQSSCRLHSKIHSRLSLPQRSDQSGHYRRWNPTFKTESAWDGFLTDSDLWFPDGDCLVYLCSKNTLGRKPTFRIPHQALRNANCDHLIDPTSLGRRNFARAARDASATTSTAMLEVYLPAPGYSSNQETFQWHVSTRNFLAWTLGKPLVGITLSDAFHNLVPRMELFRAAGVDNLLDFLSYAETVGYLDLSNSPDYALANLQLAESCHHQDLYMDSFVHCVGMYDSLPASREYLSLSRVSKALMAQSSVDLDLTVGRITKALDNFLEEEFSETYLGLGYDARLHLENFRTFLHSYHINKFGYWPLLKDMSLCAGPFRIMYQEFYSLYDYLADKDSSSNSSSQRLASGGICVLQNIIAFNQRYSFVALPHCLPLLPGPLILKRRESQRQSLSYKLLRKSNRARHDMETWSALSNAASPTDRSTTQCPLVQAYILFERETCIAPEGNLTVADARKIRWMLLYGILQMLGSLVKTSHRLKLTSLPNYSLCCSTTGVPPWKPDGFEPLARPVIVDSMRTPSPAFSIHPDCERTDYFRSVEAEQLARKVSRSQSFNAPPIARVSSFKSLRNLNILSFTTRRDSLILPRTHSTSSIPRSQEPELIQPSPTISLSQPPEDKSEKDWRNPLKLNPTRSSVSDPLQIDGKRPQILDIKRLDQFIPAEGKRTPVLEINNLYHFIDISSYDSPVPSPVWSDVFQASDEDEKEDDDDDYDNYNDEDEYDDRSSAFGDEGLETPGADAAPNAPRPRLRRLSSIYAKPLDRLRSSVYSLIVPQKRSSQMSDGTGGNIDLSDTYLQAVARS